MIVAAITLICVSLLMFIKEYGYIIKWTGENSEGMSA